MEQLQPVIFLVSFHSELLPFSYITNKETVGILFKMTNSCAKRHLWTGSLARGACKPWNDFTTNNNLTTNNELSNYSIELSVEMGVSTGPPRVWKERRERIRDTSFALFCSIFHIRAIKVCRIMKPKVPLRCRAPP